MSVVLLVVGLLPACRVKNALLSVLGRGWRVDPTARIHPVLLWRIGTFRAAARARVGPANVLRDLQRVDLGEQSAVGQFNWITAEARYASQLDPELAGSLLLERGATINSRHYLDCAGGVRLDAMCIIAGVRSTVLTHWADHQEWVLRAAPVHVGAFTMISSGVMLTAGAAVPDGSVVAAGAVVPKALDQRATLYAGVPAKPIGDLQGSAHAERSAPTFDRPDSPARPTSR